MTENRREVARRFLRKCEECRLVSSACKDELTPMEQRYFDDAVTDRPYFSYEKGGIMPQQDFRFLFPDLDEAEVGRLCVELSNELRRSNVLFFLGGKTECVRPSE